MPKPIQKINIENNCQESPIFIVGMPRSGTTLISRVLSSHSQISIAPESHFLNYWMQRFSISSLQEEKGFQKFWLTFTHSERFRYFECDASKLLDTTQSTKQNVAKSLFSNLLKQYAESNSKKRWGEKTPAHYAHVNRLLSWYPNARIIYMIRDPRGVAASMAKVPWEGNRIIAYALRWRDSIKHLRKWHLDSRVMCVKYEDFVSNPPAVLEEICQFIDEEFQDQMLLSDFDSHPKSVKLYSSKWAIDHFDKAVKPINKHSLKKWEKELSKEQIALIDYLNKKYMIELGYRISNFNMGFIGKLSANLYILGKNAKKCISDQILNRKVSRNWA